MIRLQIIIGILIISHGLVGYFTYNYAKGQEAIADNKIVKTKIENHNNDQVELQKHTTSVKTETETAKQHNDGIVIPANDCNSVDIERVWNETKFSRY